MKSCIWLRKVIKWEELKDVVWDWMVDAGDVALPARQSWLQMEQPWAEKSQEKGRRTTCYLKVYTYL